MEDKKIPSRGFQNVEHFFLSGCSKVDMESKTADAITGKNNDCIGSTVAKLEVLKRSCQGVALQAERTCDNSAWFQGAAAIIQEAISTLSEVINPVGNND